MVMFVAFLVIGSDRQLFAQTTMALTNMNAREGPQHDFRINREQRRAEGENG